MVDAISHLQPRALYAMLRACTSADARARAALSFVRGASEAAGGFLFLARTQELAFAASVEGEAPAGLIDYVHASWREYQQPRTGESQTMELVNIETVVQESTRWTSEDGARFERRVLGTHRHVNWTPIGIVMLREAPARPLRAMHHGHVHALCMALIDAHDVEVAEPVRP